MLQHLKKFKLTWRARMIATKIGHVNQPRITASFELRGKCVRFPLHKALPDKRPRRVVTRNPIPAGLASVDWPVQDWETVSAARTLHKWF